MALLAGCAPPSGAVSDVNVENARVRELLPGQSKTVAYLDLSNRGSAEVTLLKATSSHAKTIEIHQSTRRGNMVSMRRLDKVVIPGKETVRLAPGGLHLMLFGVERLPPSIEVELHWAHGEVMRVSFATVSFGAQ